LHGRDVNQSTLSLHRIRTEMKKKELEKFKKDLENAFKLMEEFE